MACKIVPKPLKEVSYDAHDLVQYLATIPDEQPSVVADTLSSLANTLRNRRSAQFHDYLVKCCNCVIACINQNTLNWELLKDNIVGELNDIYTACGLSLFDIAQCRMNLFFTVLADFVDRRVEGISISEDYKKLQRCYSLDMKYVITLMLYHEFVVDRITAIRSIYEFFDKNKRSCCAFVRMYPDRYEKSDQFAHLISNILVAIERLNELKVSSCDESMCHSYSIEISVLETRLLEYL